MVVGAPADGAVPRDWSDDDRTTAELLTHVIMNSCDRVYVQWEQGVVPVEYWPEVRGWMVHSFLPSPVVRDWWVRIPIPAGMFSPGYRDAVTREIEAIRMRAPATP